MLNCLYKLIITGSSIGILFIYIMMIKYLVITWGRAETETYLQKEMEGKAILFAICLPPMFIILFLIYFLEEGMSKYGKMVQKND